ncbi:cyanophycin synthetase-like protein [Trichormus variabilis ATCC 29413]|uniref:Cyanophycin synthetase-like protein n=3 Tax=Anabaena variabilis TaxID=264691 RepID=Q3MGK3_TRIV2|nr:MULTISPECIES: cyanophycin synthetase [Nostocaceae]ABA19883.1 cyanophycin synthetase-like protein [Trichormus variabilis ATCC 29413]MBC1216072.1 cyanophycin synthetase [Trichormus variabilis ARAD]MBC1266672.1 cyanophycin synthetase [Trichormus variabilis FSR]MBC1303310.1 cyanophycin synthetase [Trichormus variabilis N2B]MBC1313438.1 cyanophycin synthetase [Trichormus variabilis PNB]
MPLVTSIIQKIAPQIGAVVVVDPEYELVGHITFKNGKKSFFSTTKLNINGFGSAEIAKDKGYSKFFLKHFGYHVTEGQTFFNQKLCKKIGNERDIDAGFEYAKLIGFPVIIKPINLSQGKLVTKIHNKTEYYQVAKKILRANAGLIIERFYLGKDYRIVVIDDEIIAAYQRLPLSVIGDGKSNVTELIQRKQDGFIQNLGKKIIDVDDFRIKRKLQKQSLNLNSVIPNGKVVYLLDNANLSSGGEAVDVTENIHPDFQKLALNVTKDMGLRLMGLDIITQDITRPMVDYVIIEVNGSPGLTHYASIGDIQTKRVEDLYLKVLKALETEYNSEN